MKKLVLLLILLGSIGICRGATLATACYRYDVANDRYKTSIWYSQPNATGAECGRLYKLPLTGVWVAYVQPADAQGLSSTKSTSNDVTALTSWLLSQTVLVPLNP